MNEQSSIQWISVNERVPDNRRQVLAWGPVGLLGDGYTPFKPIFLGVTRFNPSRAGGSFDCAKKSMFSPFVSHVTHWAEIEGPQQEESAK